jgi:serine/threonine protein kinase
MTLTIHTTRRTNTRRTHDGNGNGNGNGYGYGYGYGSMKFLHKHRKKLHVVLAFLTGILIGAQIYSSFIILDCEKNIITKNIYTATGGSSSQFDDLEFVKLIGEGDISYGFEVRFKRQNQNQNRKNDSATSTSTGTTTTNKKKEKQQKRFIAKIAADQNLYFSDLEIDIFRELKKPPSISNIPEIHSYIRSIPNPFTNATLLKRKDLNLSPDIIESLGMNRLISIIVMDLLEYKRRPYASKSLQEIRLFTKSLLESFSFVHSRNIMHCDLHNNNYFWNGQQVYLFDWNSGFRYDPNQDMLIHHWCPTHYLYPPEAKGNKSAIHTSVYAFDVYTIGLILEYIIEECCNITSKTIIDNHTTSEELMAYDLAEYMMTSDPYKRPDTNQALQHQFFLSSQKSNTSHHQSKNSNNFRPLSLT